MWQLQVHALLQHRMPAGSLENAQERVPSSGCCSKVQKELDSLVNKPRCLKCNTTEGTKKLLLYKRCEFALYCCVECQIADWEIHKALCKGMKKNANTLATEKEKLAVRDRIRAFGELYRDFIDAMFEVALIGDMTWLGDTHMVRLTLRDLPEKASPKLEIVDCTLVRKELLPREIQESQTQNKAVMPRDNESIPLHYVKFHESSCVRNAGIFLPHSTRPFLFRRYFPRAEDRERIVSNIIGYINEKAKGAF